MRSTGPARFSCAVVLIIVAALSLGACSARTPASGGGKCLGISALTACGDSSSRSGRVIGMRGWLATFACNWRSSRCRGRTRFYPAPICAQSR